MNHREVAEQIVASVTETRYITPEGYSDVLAKESALIDAIESALLAAERDGRASLSTEKPQREITVGEQVVTIDQQGVYHCTPVPPYSKEELVPPTSEAAKAHGLRRIARRHYDPNAVNYQPDTLNLIEKESGDEAVPSRNL